MTTSTALLFGFSLFFGFSASASLPEDLLAVGQGVASPSTTSLVNVGRGLVGFENPSGLMYTKGFRVAVEATKDPASGTSTGFEGSYAGPNYGLAVGNYKSACDGCVANTAFILGAAFKYADIGLRYQKTDTTPTYGLGFLFNAAGKHRFGLHVEDEIPVAPNTSTLKTGVGYSYVNNDDTINVEMTQSKTQTTSTTKNSIGYKKKVSNVDISMTYEMGEGGQDLFWMGVGFRGQTFHLAIYSAYNTQLMAVLSAFF